jgi:hypothetical protein
MARTSAWRIITPVTIQSKMSLETMLCAELTIILVFLLTVRE